jgi:hypothetical protein
MTRQPLFLTCLLLLISGALGGCKRCNPCDPCDRQPASGHGFVGTKPDYPFGAGGFRLSNADKEDIEDATTNNLGSLGPIDHGSNKSVPSSVVYNVASTTLAMKVKGGTTRSITFGPKGESLLGVYVTYMYKNSDGTYHIKYRLYYFTSKVNTTDYDYVDNETNF